MRTVEPAERHLALRDDIEPSLVPVCTDLISIGSDSIVRRDSTLLGYLAQSNYIYTGPISIGDDVFTAAIDPDTLRERLRAKTRYNVASMVGLLASTWLYFFFILYSLFVAARYFPLHGFAAVLAFGVFALITGILWFSFLEKAGRGFKPLAPMVPASVEEPSRFQSIWRWDVLCAFVGVVEYSSI